MKTSPLRSVIALAFAFVFSSTLAIACRSKTDVRDDPTGAGGATATTLYGDPDQCGRCVAAECGAAQAACDAEPECAAYVACLFTCPVDSEGGPEDACEAACPRPESSAAVEAQQGLAACAAGSLVRYSCPACPGAYPALTDPCFVHEGCPDVPPPDVHPCVACGHLKCCGLREAFEANPISYELLTCYEDCPFEDHACWVACDEEYPDGVEDLAAIWTCNTVHCYQECDIGEDGGGPDACSECYMRECEASYAFLCTADGWTLDRCVRSCGDDAACDADCFDKYPGGVEQAADFAACYDQRCGDVCP